MLICLKLIKAKPEISQPPDSSVKYKTVEINSQRLNVEIADSNEKIAEGLSDRDQIGSDGMLFVFNQPSNQPFWMKNMRFPVDLLWINNDKVSGMEKNMPIPVSGTPDNKLDLYFPPTDVTSALELPSGSIERLNINIGDQITHQ